ncbi:RNA-directed DNA polymerase, eukaryota, reverse transcriptase zinc-binding domain protein [Tanacetum coccineum]
MTSPPHHHHPSTLQAPPSPPWNNISNNANENLLKHYQKNSSYASIVKIDDVPRELDFILTIMTENGSEVVVFDEELVKKGSERWCLTICGQFVGYHMHINELRYNIKRMWGRYGIAEIDKWKNGCYMFKFNDETGMNVVIEKGPWMVRNKPLFVQKWSSEFGMQKVEPRKMPVWVKINNVPLEAWCVKGISALASDLGKPILIDTMTANMCHKGIGKNIKGSKKVQVMYDWMPPVCTHCKVFGHDKRRCMNGGAVMNDKTVTNTDEKINDNAGKGKGSQQDSNANVMEQGQWKNYKNEYNRNGGYANYKINPQNQRQNNGSWRMGRPEINKKEYRKRQNVAENNMKNKESSNLNNNQWKVGEEVVNEIRNSANKYYVLYSLPEDNDSELRTLKERIIVVKFLKDKVQLTIKESITWSKDMIEYFKTKWDEDRLKESNAGNDTGEMKDVLELNEGTAKVIRDNEECNKGCRIVIGWDNDETNIQVLHKTSQSIFCVIRDLNVTLRPNEHSCGSSVMTTDMLEFQECLNKIKVEDICRSGLQFTWTKNLQKTKASNTTGILKKLNRVMSNEAFINKFPNAHAKFLPYLIFDHTPSILSIPTTIKKKIKAFRFSNYLTDKQEFLPIMKSLKKPLDNLRWCKGNLFKRVEYLRSKLQRVQTDIDIDPFNIDLRDLKVKLVKEFYESEADEEKQARSMKEIENCETFFHRRISLDVAQRMIIEISEKEIKNAMFDINDSKSPGPDGFTAAFF